MRKSALATFVVMFASLILGGCASDRMAQLKTAPAIVTSPAPNSATMIFFRSSIVGGAVQSSVFDVSTKQSKLIGIVSASTRIAYPMSPGKHRFMAIGEAADFLDVTASAGKIYYARVSPRIGWWKARFALEAVPGTETGLASELSDLNWVANTKKSQDWAVQNMPSIESKRAEYFPEWQKSADRQSLKPEDGK